MDALFDLLTPIGINETNFQFMCVAAIMSISIYMTLYGGMFSLANAGFMAIGAYVAVVLTQQYAWPFWPAILTGGLAAMLVAIPVGLTVLRLNDIYLAIATIGFGEIVRVLILNFDKLYDQLFDERVKITNGAIGIKGIPVLTQTEHLLLVLALLAFFLYRMHRSRFGRALAAIRQDPRAAASLGIHVVYYKNLAFVMGAFVAGLGGGLSGHLTRIITPDTYGFNQAVDILAYAVLGGTQNLLGPITGGMLLEWIPELLRRLGVFQGLSDLTGIDFVTNQAQIIGLLNGVVLLLVIIYLPGGLSDPKTWRGLWVRMSRLWRGRGEA
jgi:branched-chain amino acid transport system permease protein